MQPSELEIRREVEALRDIKRRSTAQGGPGAIPLDPDLPEIPSSPSSTHVPAWGGSSISEEHAEDSIADDPSHLFWVPASLHPEIAPKEFRNFLKEHAREGAASLQRANSASAATGSTDSSLGRRKSMLSRQYKPSESDGVENERVVIRRNKSTIRSPAPQLTIADLQKLDELAEKMADSDDPTKIRTMLRRSLSLNMSPASAEQPETLPEVDDADSPIIPRGPNQILRRAARTKIRKPNLQGDGGGHRFPSTRRERGRAQTIATSNGNEQDHEEPFRRPQAPSPEDLETDRSDRPISLSDVFDAYTDRRDSLTSSESHERSVSEEDAREPERRYTSSPPPMIHEMRPPSPEGSEEQPQQSVSPPPVIHQPIPQRQLAAAAAQQEIPLSRSPSPSYSESGSTTEMGTSVTSLQPSEVHLPSTAVDGPSTAPVRPPLTSSPSSRGPARKEKEKKGLFKWGSKDDKKKAKGEGSKEKEKDKDSGFFGSLFGKKKQDDSSSSSGLLHGSAGPATAAALLGASKANRTNVRSPSPQPPGNYARYPIHVERAIYRLSHIKLANARRPLLEQVLISNLMFWYLGIINKATTTPAVPTVQNAAAANAQPANPATEQQDKELQEREREQKERAERERAERERAERERAEQQKKESGRKGSLTRAPKGAEASGSRRAEMPVRTPQYESQHRAMEQEYGYGGYGYGMPAQNSSSASGQRVGSAPPQPMANNSAYYQYNNVRSPQPVTPQSIPPNRTGSPTGYPARTGSPNNQMQQPVPVQAGPYYYGYDNPVNNHSQQQQYSLPPGAMLPTAAMDQAWLGVNPSNSTGKSSPSPPPNSNHQSQFAYSPPSPPSSPPQQQQQHQTPPRRPRSPPPTHLVNSGHPRHPNTTPPGGGRAPGRSLSATAVSSQAQQKARAQKRPEPVRRRSSDSGAAYTEEDVPLAVWQQQQRASGRR